MHINVEHGDQYATLHLRGEFDTFYCKKLQEEIDALASSGIVRVSLNLRLVKFINSTALGAVIKAHKLCRAEGGELVISQPSPVVRDVMTKVGIDKLISLCDTEKDATKAIIRHLNQKELAGEVPVDQEKVVISFADEIRNKMIGGKKALIGLMSNVNGQKIQFLWNGTKHGINADQAKQLFIAGSEVQLKFHVKMIRQEPFQTAATVDSTEVATDGGVRITASFTKKMPEADRKGLTQYADDMAFLKRQLPGT